ncbi:MAG TPA: hypothetical protein VMT34_07885, partial [Aggregatilineales bacterium]|nr:hypothetical protein [Aggregatilineales bacterium]
MSIPPAEPTPDGNLPDVGSVRVRLGGEWQVISVPLDDDSPVDALSFDAAVAVAECGHLQPILYPRQPYWGGHLRAINQRAWIYRRFFRMPDAKSRRARLRFEGVDYFATAWLNGERLGQHEGHFAPFTFDVTPLLRDENTLLVRVSAPWDSPNPSGTYPIDHVIRGLIKGLYEHGEGVIPPDVNPIGIWRPAWLILDDGIRLDRVRIRAEMDGTVDLNLLAANATDALWQGTLSLKIEPETHDGPGATLSLPVALKPGEQPVEVTLHVPEPRLWWPWDHGCPDLYRLTAQLKDDRGKVYSTVGESFGLRRVRLERSPDRFVFRINDRPLFVRGTAYIPALYLSQCSEDTVARDLESVRDLHLNLLRVHVHVSPPFVYDLCDRA